MFLFLTISTGQRVDDLTNWRIFSRSKLLETIIGIHFEPVNRLTKAGCVSIPSQGEAMIGYKVGSGKNL